MIAIAVVIALPIAWWGGQKWLDNFVYKTTLSWWVFIAGAAGLLFAALVILGLRTIKAATANPVNSLRSE